MARSQNFNQNGNILFLILLAIILFAALTYAVNGGLRGGDSSSAKKESVTSIAATILNYSAQMEQTINRLRLTNGCSDTQVSFENTVQSGYGNSVAPLDKRCNVFDPAGGGMSWQVAPSGSLDPAMAGNFEYGQYFVSKNTRVINAGTDAGPPDGNDLLLVLPYLSVDLCQQINKSLGYTGSISSQGGFFDSAKFNGIYQVTTYSLTPPAPALRLEGCVLMNGRGFVSPTPPPHHVYYKVLLAR